ncbi:Hsp70 family protein [Streptomyces sp. NPDC004244]
MTQPYEQDGGSTRTPPHAPAEHILVVDLGTTVTTATLLMGPEAQPIPDPVAGARSWPSCAFVEPHEIVVGELADGRRLGDPQRFRAEFKRRLGGGPAAREYIAFPEQQLHEDPSVADPFPCDGSGAHGRHITAGDLSAALLAAVRAEAERLGGAPVDRLLVTCPGDFAIGNRADLRWTELDEACRAAGFTDVEYLHEPVAAAFAPLSGPGPAPGSHLLVYDFGGGTFDAAVIRTGAGHHHVLAADSLQDCGGADIDALILKEITATLGAEELHHAEAALRIAARDAKHQLSTDATAHIDLGPLRPGIRLTRERLEDLVHASGLLERTHALVDKLLGEAGVDTQRLAGVLLVGGTSRMPLVAHGLAHLTAYRPMDIGCAVVDGATAWARTAPTRTVLPDPPATALTPVRWPLPRDGRATLSRWLVQPGDRMAAGDPVARVSLADGTLWDLCTSVPGTLAHQHRGQGDRFAPEDWLATVRTAPLDPTPGTRPRALRPVLRLPGDGHAGPAAFAADGSRFAWTAADGTTVRVTELGTGAERPALHTPDAVAHVAVPGPGELLTASATVLRHWQEVEGGWAQTWEAETGVLSLTVARDGSFAGAAHGHQWGLLLGRAAPTGFQRDFATARTSGWPGPLTVVDGGRLMVSASPPHADAELRWQDGQGGRLLELFGVDSVAVAPDCRTVWYARTPAAAHRHRLHRLLRSNTGSRPRYQLPNVMRAVREELDRPFQGAAALHRLGDGDAEPTLHDLGIGPVTGLVCDPSGRFLTVGIGTRTVLVVHLPGLEPAAVTGLLAEPFTELGPGPGGGGVAVRAADGTLTVLAPAEELPS